MKLPTNDFAELSISQTSDLMLEQIEQGWEPPCTTDDLELVRYDAMRAAAIHMPSPVDVARELVFGDPEAAEALVRAWIGKQQPYAQALRVADDDSTPVLRSLGLVGWVGKGAGCSVTGFGVKVRRVLIKWNKG